MEFNGKGVEIVITNWGTYQGELASIGLRAGAYRGIHLFYFKIKDERKFMLAVLKHDITYKVNK